MPTVTNQALGLGKLDSVGPYFGSACSYTILPTRGDTGNPENNVACEGFNYTYNYTFTSLPAFSLTLPQIQPGATYCVALFHSNNVGTGGPFTKDVDCLGSATGWVATGPAGGPGTITSPTPTTDGFPQSVSPGHEYVLVLYQVSPSLITVGTGGLTLTVGNLLSLNIGGVGPFSVGGTCISLGILGEVLNGNVLSLTTLLPGSCTLTITGPGGTISIPVVSSLGTPLTVLPTSLLNLLLGSTQVLTVTGTGPFTTSGCTGIVNASVLNNTINVTALGPGACLLMITGPTGSVTVPIVVL